MPSGPVILRHMSRAQGAREDCTALMLAKLHSIAQDQDRPYYQLVTEITATQERSKDVVHTLVGLVVQYSEGAGGFLKLCEFLVQKLQERNAAEFPVERKWVSKS